MAANGGNPTPLADEAPGTARRKIRKGTRSCWQCKRRKIRCIFDGASSAETVCLGCKQRETACISQEFDDKSSHTRKRRYRREDRLDRVQALVEQLVHEARIPTKPSDAALPPNALPADAGIGREDSSVLRISESMRELDHCEDYRIQRTNKESTPGTGDIPQTTSEPRLQKGKYSGVFQEFRTSLPFFEDANIIWQRDGNVSGYLHQILVQSHNHLETNGLESPQQWAHLLKSTSHPILVARRMLILAIFLQNLRQSSDEAQDGGCLSFAESALSLIPTNDDLIETIEGLECIILEGVLWANSGKLRLALVAFRRSIVVAQLLGIHRGEHTSLKFIDPDTKADPNVMWFRILYLERLICILLGMPQGSLDNSIVSEDLLMAKPHPMERLERLHCDIVSNILSRNERNSYFQNILVTQEIDVKLREAAKTMAPHWWLIPDLAGVTDNVGMFWTLLRLSNQLFHYFLLLQLHVPYLLRASTDHPSMYSKVICINSCREVLSRFIVFRSVNTIASCCRAADYFALTAAVTLLLAHIDSYRMPPTHNILAHQRLTDRAMTEKALDSMSKISRTCEDILGKRGVDILEQLLAIELQASRGLHYTIQCSSLSRDSALAERKNVLEVRIPYFGNVIINLDDPILSKENSSEDCEFIQDDTFKPGLGLSPMVLCHSLDKQSQVTHQVTTATTNQQESSNGDLSSLLLQSPYRSHQQSAAAPQSFSTSVDNHYLCQVDPIPDNIASFQYWAPNNDDPTVLQNLQDSPLDLME